MNEVPGLLDDASLAVRERMCFMHDGVPPHFSLVMQDVLNICSYRWIGQGGPTVWPPSSPNLNPVNFCVGGQLKALVYATLSATYTLFQQRTVNSCHAIRNTTDIFERT
jgi:hypothetical protein